ncbi:MAG: VanW family protein [Armatimonadetes bacterium]|nr:VanW family protein [Armatimonadota bacterium]
MVAVSGAATMGGPWFRLRVLYHQLQRHLAWRLHPLPWAARHTDPSDWPLVVAGRRSPLRRAPDGPIGAHTEEKTQNLRLACARVDGCLIGPGEVFSFCRTVGPTPRLAQGRGRRRAVPALQPALPVGAGRQCRDRRAAPAQLGPVPRRRAHRAVRLRRDGVLQLRGLPVRQHAGPGSGDRGAGGAA